MSDKFQWPDISTYKGDRKEYYDIKPNSPSGLKDGQKKMKNVKKMYNDYGLGFYKPGIFYPKTIKKKITLLSKFNLNLKYLLDQELQELGVDIFEIYLEVNRAEEGILLYTFCVRFKLQKKKEKLAKHVAARILTHFIRTTTIDLDTETIRRIMVATSNLEIVEIDGKRIERPEPISAITNVFYIPMLNLRWEPTADELDNQKDSIRNAMYSRLLGKPGERYFLCSDENYFQQIHNIPSRAQIHAASNLIRVQYKMMAFGPRNMAYVTPLMTNFSLAELMQMKEWDDINKKRENILIGATIVFVAVSLVVLTAAFVVAAAGTGTAVLVAGGASTAEGAGFTNVVSIPLGAAVNDTVANVVSLPLVEAAKDIAIASSIMLLIAPSDAKAAAVPDEVLTGRATSSSLASWIANNINDARLMKVLAEQGVKKAIEEAVALGDVGLISISVAPVYERESESNHGNKLGMPPVGRLYLVKVKDSIGKLPPMYGEFNISNYAAEKQRFNRMHFFGSFYIDNPKYP